MVFIDTGGWIAVSVTSDSFHEIASDYYLSLLARRVQLFTSNYVLDETITHIRYRFGHRPACWFCDLYEKAEQRQLVTTLWVDAPIVQDALETFRKYSDQRFSFTDCTSFALMQRHSLKEAFAFDSHFETFGFLREPQLPTGK
ncbi:MAG: type II toxin-antitoxin system VapC family toxin [Gammaproteobacteria bacterium]